MESINTSELNPLTSKVYKEENITTSGTHKVRWHYVEGNGILNEFSINSDKDTLKIKLVIDDTEVYNETINWFTTNTALMNNVDTSGVFVLSIKDIYFKYIF